ncbi:MAG: NnrS family protein [Pseudobdellovibrionaceae bacterium]
MGFERIQKDPFRLFFPLGCLFAFLGLVPWLSLLTENASYPAQFHQVVMINGFMLSFVSGFLLTAIPRFTKTGYAQLWEVLLVLLFLLLAVGFSFQSSLAWHFLFAGFVQASIFVFAGRRFFKRQADPPISFMFVGLGLGLWLFTNFYFFFTSLGVWAPWAAQSWQSVFTHGAILSLVLGIGSRLFPALLGWQEVLPAQQQGSRQKYFFLVLTVLFLLSYFVSFPENANLMIRAAIVTFLFVRYWKILKLPKVRNWFNWNLWLAGWCILLSQFVFWFEDGRAVHFLHFLFVGGFTWMTLLISLHVEMAHRPKPDFGLKQSQFFLLLAVIMVAATLTRVTAIFWQQIYLRHLAYAAVTLLMALCLWLRIFFKKSEAK